MIMSCQILWHLFGFVLFHNPILIVMKDLENNSGLQTPNYKVLTNVIISATLYVCLSLCLSGADWCIRCSRYQRSFLSMKATQPIRAQCLEGSDQWEVSPLWAGLFPQGAVITLPYCYLNSEVQQALLVRWRWEIFSMKYFLGIEIFSRLWQAVATGEESGGGVQQEERLPPHSSTHTPHRFEVRGLRSESWFLLKIWRLDNMICRSEWWKSTSWKHFLVH